MAKPKIRIQLHRDGMTEVLTSEETRRFVDEQVQRVAAAARGMHNAQGYEGDTIIGTGSKPRAHGMVKTTDRHARRSNAKHNTLVKALAGGAR